MNIPASGRLLLPALRGQMGRWVYYVALMKLKDLAERVRLADEIHTSKTLNELIQRQVSNRAGQVRDYLLNQEQRFFNSLVIAVYGGSPDWYDLDVKSNPQVDIGELPEALEGTLGILALTGNENLF